MNRLISILLHGIVCATATACIRQTLPPCPPLSITLTVKDKNYFNVDDAVKLGLMERQADTLSFSSYVHSLYYILHDAEGGGGAGGVNQYLTPRINKMLFHITK